MPPEGLRPMSTFDPTQPAILHDRLNDKIITWLAEEDMIANYREYATLDEEGLVSWDGLILDGWGNVLGG